MQIGFHRYQDVFQRVLDREQMNTAAMSRFDYKFQNISDKLEEKMTKTLECMAGRDGQLYTEAEVVIANNNFFKKCVAKSFA